MKRHTDELILSRDRMMRQCRRKGGNVTNDMTLGMIYHFQLDGA